MGRRPERYEAGERGCDRFLGMNGHGLNGTRGGTKRKRATAAKRPKKGPTPAQRTAMRRIVAESGVTPSKEGMDAILQELRRE